MFFTLYVNIILLTVWGRNLTNSTTTVNVTILMGYGPSMLDWAIVTYVFLLVNMNKWEKVEDLSFQLVGELQTKQRHNLKGLKL